MAVYEDNVGEKTPQLVCNSCAERRERIRKQKAEELKREEEKKAQEARYKAAAYDAAVKKSRNRGLIWAAIIVGVAFLIYLISALTSGVKAGIVIPTALVGLVFLYTFVAQLFWDGAVVTCASAAAHIGTPGVIFEFSLDGFIFLIAMKILFACIRLLVFLLTGLVCILAAMLISPFTFFPALARVNSGDLVL